MSKVLSSVAVTEFDSLVKHAYQNAGLLKGAVTVRNNVVGDTYKFRNMGKGLANQKSTSDLVTPMDISHGFATATLQNWNAPEYTDMFDAQTVNFDEKQELASTIAQSLGRRCDQLVIDAMDAETTYAGTVVEGGTNLTTEKVIEAQVALRAQGVPNSNLYAAINAQGLGGLLNQEEITSSDYNNVKALVNGDVDTFGGFKFVVIEDRAEGGLTEAGDIVDSYFFSQDAVGLAIGIDIKTDVDWIADRTSWLCNGMLKAGAVSRDGLGIVKVQYDKTA
jgi:Tfp pilus assembly protein PilV